MFPRRTSDRCHASRGHSLARARRGGAGAGFRGRAEGVELESCTFVHLMLAVEKPFGASNWRGQLTNKACPDVVDIVLVRKTCKAPMPDLPIVPVDTIVIAKPAAEGLAIAVDLEPTLVEPDTTIDTIGVGDNGSSNALDAKGSLGCAPETIDARGMAAGPRGANNTSVTWVLGRGRHGRRDVGSAANFNVGVRRSRTSAATRSSTLVTFGRRATGGGSRTALAIAPSTEPGLGRGVDAFKVRNPNARESVTATCPLGK